MIKKIILSFVVIFFTTFFNAISQIPNVNNDKVVCWLNGCNDPRACCKVLKGGETCANTTFSDGSGNTIPKCDAATQTNCIECLDLEGIASHHMGDYTYSSTNCSVDYYQSTGIVQATHLGVSKNAFSFSNYTIPDAGLAIWYKANSDILTFYKATASLNPPYYLTATLDSVKVDLDTLFGYSIPNGQQLDFIKTKWLEEKLKITIAPNPASGQFSILTESKHPVLVSANNLVLEIFSASGQLITTKKISSNGKYQFEVPENYASSYLVYKISWDNSTVRGLISITKQ